MTIARIFACAMLYLDGWRSSDKQLLMRYLWLCEDDVDEICHVLANFEKQMEANNGQSN